jgi:hypothetical protein
MRLVWNSIWKKEQNPYMSTMMAFDEHVEHQSYGDDSLTAVSDEAIKVFNQVTVSATFPEFGFEYTDECKGLNGDIVESKDVSEVNFLKRTFRPCPKFDYIAAPLAKDTIFEMLQWIRTGDDDVAQAIENCQNAVREASLHEPEFFKTLKADITQAACDIDLEQPLYLPKSYTDTRMAIRFGKEYKPY